MSKADDWWGVWHLQEISETDVFKANGCIQSKWIYPTVWLTNVVNLIEAGK